MAEIIYVSCPFCGLSRVLEKKGSSAIARGIYVENIKGRIRFDHMDLGKAKVIQVRESRRGKEDSPRMRRGGGPGFQVVGGLTLAELRSNPEYEDLKEQMLGTAHNLIQILEKEL